jgi:hypothetical protein
MKPTFAVFFVDQNRHRHTESRPCATSQAPLAASSVGDWISTTFTLFPPPLNGAPPHHLLFPEPKRPTSMPPTNWPLDHHLPFPLWPYKRSGTSTKKHRTPHPLSLWFSSAKGASWQSSPDAGSYLHRPANSGDPAPSRRLKRVPLRPLLLSDSNCRLAPSHLI